MEYIAAAFVFGLAGGLNPGVLSIFVLHQILKHGNRAGLLASFAPFVSDGPIILAVLLLLSSTQHLDTVLMLLSVAGATYLFYLALSLWRGVDVDAPDTRSTPASFLTAVKVNLLNPAPYMFWATVGSAYLLRGNTLQAASFVVVMLATLALSKFALAKSIAMLGARFNPRIQASILKILSLLLLVFALRLLFQAWKMAA